MRAQRPGQCHVTLADFLENHGKGCIVEAHAAVFFGNRDTKQSQLFHLVNEVVRNSIFGVVLSGHRFHFVAHKVAHHADNLSAGFQWGRGDCGHGGSCCILGQNMPRSLSQRVRVAQLTGFGGVLARLVYALVE